MPAHVARGIILSIAVIAALGLAVIENPIVQEWLEEQRRRVIELLRTLGEELDPQTRRTAEAFAYEGREITNDDTARQDAADGEVAQREAAASMDAAAMATGRSMTNASAVRRIPVSGPTSPQEAEARRQKGQEYLARRESELFELQQRRKAAQADNDTTPPTPTSFDALVDEDGNLRTSEKIPVEQPQSAQPIPALIQEKMNDVEQMLNQPLPKQNPAASISESGWQAGSHFGNPFGDEYALERSITPRPPVPPKIAISDLGVGVSRTVSAASARENHEDAVELPAHIPERNDDEMSYEDQLALALALSHEESLQVAAQENTQVDAEDDDLKAAIAASLKDMEYQHAAAARAWPEAVSPQPIRAQAQPLVDLSTPDTPSMSQRHHNWELLFARPAESSRVVSPTSHRSETPSEVSDELYRITPNLARARLADPQPGYQQEEAQTARLPFDPVHDSVTSNSRPGLQVMRNSFYSAPSEPSPMSAHTLDHDSPQVVNGVPLVPMDDRSRASTPRAASSIGFRTDTWSDTDGSYVAAYSRVQSPSRSTTEVIDLDEDSDIDMVSEVGERSHTPDSWSEVGSRDGESEVDDGEHHSSHVAA